MIKFALNNRSNVEMNENEYDDEERTVNLIASDSNPLHWPEFGRSLWRYECLHGDQAFGVMVGSENLAIMENGEVFREVIVG